MYIVTEVLFNRAQSLGDSLELKSIWIEKISKCW